MEHQLKVSNKPLHYAKITLETRKELAHLVQDKQWSISKASRKLGIRPSTGKLIMKKYREKGIFFQKKSDKLARASLNAQDTIQWAQQDQNSGQNAPKLLSWETIPIECNLMANNIYLLSGGTNILQNNLLVAAGWSFMMSSSLPYYPGWSFYC